MSRSLSLPPRGMSWHHVLADLPPKHREAFLDALGPQELIEFERDWFYKLRREQIAPEGDWDTWYVKAGRGWGKTLCGSAFVNAEVAEARAGRIALIGPTAADVRDVMIDGETGILNTARHDCRPTYYSSLRKVSWPNGAEALAFAAEEPDRLRGPQFHLGWADEMAAWKYLEHTWDMYQPGLRLGAHPRTLITTTPKPLKLLREIAKSPRTIVTIGATFDNRNLPESTMRRLREKYEGTRLGRQELYAEDLDQAAGALWNRDLLERHRLRSPTDLPGMVRIVVAIDPAMTKKSTSDEVGLIVAGLGVDGIGYTLADLSARMTPRETAQRAIGAFDQWSADRIVAEANNGGDWIEEVLRNERRGIAYKKLHASRSKQARAEPVAALWEQSRARMVGYYPVLEDELCAWEPVSGAPSPNRLDALVWGFTELMLGNREYVQLHVRT